MKFFKKVSMLVLVLTIIFGSIGLDNAYAATTPSLGAAAEYAILSSTYTNTLPGTTINGSIGFTTGPAVAPTGTQANYGSGGTYATAGTDQGSVLTDLNSQACTFTFPSGAVDLSTDTTHGPIGVYTPGVYCTSGPGAASIGTGGITLNGAGTYIFKINGALTSVANSVVTSNGASACDVFWAPTEATTLGADSTFFGTNIDNAGITTGSNVSWIGRALSFGGTVTTGADNTITAPTCSTPGPVATPATLNVIKTVINDNGGTATASNFSISVKLSGVDVAGSPAFGVSTPGTSYSLAAGSYIVSESASSTYTQSFSGDCDSSGNITLLSGEVKTCTITNNDIAVGVVATTTATTTPATITVIKTVINDNGGVRTASSFPLYVNGSLVISGAANTFSPGMYTVTEATDVNYTQTFSGDCSSSGVVSILAGENKVCAITNNDIATTTPVVVIPPTLATLSVVKIVINDNGGTRSTSSFPLYVNGNLVLSGAVNTFSPGTYTVTETNDGGYVRIFSLDCNGSGQVVLSAGQNKTCIITNNDIAATVVTNSPTFPSTGISPEEAGAPWNTILPLGLLTVLLSISIFRKNTVFQK